MGTDPYTARTVTRTFPELGKNIKVTIKNPLVRPGKDLALRTVGKSAQPELGDDLDDLLLAIFEVMAALIVEWTVYDPDDETAVALPLPTTGDVLRDKVPVGIQNWLIKQRGDAVNPR